MMQVETRDFAELMRLLAIHSPHSHGVYSLVREKVISRFEWPEVSFVVDSFPDFSVCIARASFKRTQVTHLVVVASIAFQAGGDMESSSQGRPGKDKWFFPRKFRHLSMMPECASFRKTRKNCSDFWTTLNAWAGAAGCLSAVPHIRQMYSWSSKKP
ncbi:hypothetical protein RvY_19181-1 [Ramazzottius varieornatus]|uniref:Uncharacterized protein n=1 Tax=Ramazzottius varieornatus TaxID=947166 RepID=A0A1D1W8H5_RAMVA|nr:hypothetical protein RvY_19181-1 [Ramazzottius varieornatus]